MFLSGKACSLLSTLVAAGLLFQPTAARASSITLDGLFHHDDDVQLFDLTVATAGSVDLRSYGYAGGSTSTGLSFPSGGFDTILTLFSASGNFLAESDDGAGVATDPSTGFAADARITTNLAAGNYILALTQYDNFSSGNLADGFVESGNPNFTANPSFATGGPCPGNVFRDISGTAGRCRSGDWAVNFDNVVSVTPVAPIPEPGSIALLCAGLLGLGLLRVKRRRALALPGLLLGAWSVVAQAQQQPDYSNVPDYLNGNRTLLQDQDIVIAAYNAITPSPGILHSYLGATAVVNTANGATVGQPSRVNNQNTSMTDDRILRPFAGRLYESGHDQYLTVIPTPDAPYLLMQDGTAPTNLPSFPSVKLGSKHTTFSAVMADFNGDGYAGLAVNFGPGDESGDMVVFNYAEPNFTFQISTLAPGAMLTVPYDHLAGTGLLEITWDANVPPGFVNSGLFSLYAQWWSGDPQASGTVASSAMNDIPAPRYH